MKGGPSFEDLVLEVLTSKGYSADNLARQPIYIQSFEQGNLQYLATKTDLPLIQLLGGWCAPLSTSRVLLLGVL